MQRRKDTEMTNNTGDTLKACPFCGFAGYEYGFANQHKVRCKHPICPIFNFGMNIDLWQSRAHPEPTGDRMAAIDLNNGVREKLKTALEDAIWYVNRYGDDRKDKHYVEQFEAALSLLAGDE